MASNFQTKNKTAECAVCAKFSGPKGNVETHHIPYHMRGSVNYNSVINNTHWTATALKVSFVIDKNWTKLPLAYINHITVL